MEIKTAREYGAQLRKLQQIKALSRAQIQSFAPHQREAAIKLIPELTKAIEVYRCRHSFRYFCRYAWRQMMRYDMVWGQHIERMGRELQDVERGKTKRVIISMPPRHCKSEMSSWLLPAWFLGRNPGKKIIMATHLEDLAKDFGMKVRNTIPADWYQEIFPDTQISPHKSASGNWQTTQLGTYLAVGVGSQLAGVGADLLIIDDPHSTKEVTKEIPDKDKYDAVYRWYQSGPIQRLQPSGRIVLVQTRWAEFDLAGRLLDNNAEEGSEFHYKEVVFSAFRDAGCTQPLWPEFWTVAELLEKKRVLTPLQWASNYMQNPSDDTTAYIKRGWWQDWCAPSPPQNLGVIVQSWDCASSAKSSADYSACITLGTFNVERDGHPMPVVILLDAWQDKVEYPHLKQAAIRKFNEFHPDLLIVEKRGVGEALIPDLRSENLHVEEFISSHTANKEQRVNQILPLFIKGQIYAPTRKRFSEVVIDQCARFPTGEYDDLVDALTQALIRYQRTGIMQQRKQPNKRTHRGTGAVY